VTFGEGVLRLVRAGGLFDLGTRDSTVAASETLAEAESAEPAFALAPEVLEDVESTSVTAASEAAAAAVYKPGLADIDAAVTLIAAGLATRVVLTGFPSWPGLLWEAYKLADASGVVILPSVVRPGGRVDIVIERDPAANG
jgi:hypothetical protein